MSPTSKTRPWKTTCGRSASWAWAGNCCRRCSGPSSSRLDEDLTLRGWFPAEPRTFFHYPHDGGKFSAGAASRCVGVGKCRGDEGGVMCPSYRVTREEEHSTRGRARLLMEMVRGDVVTDGWHSTEARDALDLCLACKACRKDARSAWTWPPTRRSSWPTTTRAGSGPRPTTRWAGCRRSPAW